MQGKFLLIILALALLVACRQNFAPKQKTINDDTVSSTSKSDVVFDDNGFGICYSDFTKDKNTQKGLIGTFKGRNLFYEFWSYPGSVGLTADYILLRTDTSFVNNYDFCFGEFGEGGVSPDSIICKKLNPIDSSWTVVPNLILDEIPTFIQSLIPIANGWRFLANLNRGGSDDPQILIKDDKILLIFWTFDQESSWLIKETYSFKKNHFILTMTDTLSQSN